MLQTGSLVDAEDVSNVSNDPGKGKSYHGGTRSPPRIE